MRPPAKVNSSVIQLILYPKFDNYINISALNLVWISIQTKLRTNKIIPNNNICFPLQA